MAYQDEVLADTPLLYARLSGADATTAALDSSGNARHGATTYPSTLIYAQPSLIYGSSDASLSFGGGGAVAWVSPTWADVSSITIEAWIYKTVSGLASIIDRDGSGSRHWQFRINSNQKFEFTWWTTSTGPHILAGSTTLSLNAVYHVAATYNAATGVANIYLNGVLDGTLSSGAIALKTGTKTVSIGYGVGGGTAAIDFWTGRIDDAAIYGTALSPARITAHYNAGKSTNPVINKVSAAEILFLEVPAATASVQKITTTELILAEQFSYVPVQKVSAAEILFLEVPAATASVQKITTTELILAEAPQPVITPTVAATELLLAETPGNTAKPHKLIATEFLVSEQVVGTVTSFTADRTTAWPNQRVLFTSTSDGFPDTYLWDFGPGSTASSLTSRTASVSWSSIGSKTVSLTTSRSGSAPSVSTTTFNVVVNPYPRPAPGPPSKTWSTVKNASGNVVVPSTIDPYGILVLAVRVGEGTTLPTLPLGLTTLLNMTVLGSTANGAFYLGWGPAADFWDTTMATGWTSSEISVYAFVLSNAEALGATASHVEATNYTVAPSLTLDTSSLPNPGNTLLLAHVGLTSSYNTFVWPSTPTTASGYLPALLGSTSGVNYIYSGISTWLLADARRDPGASVVTGKGPGTGNYGWGTVAVRVTGVPDYITPAPSPPVQAVISEVAVSSPAARADIANAVVSIVAVNSPAATTALENVGKAPAGLVIVSSPAATSTVTINYGDISASLAIATTTSGVLRAMDPATAASEGMTAPVEVQIWAPDNTRMLAVADGRMNMQWLDDMNDVGSGNFALSRWDPKATTQNLALFNLVRFVYAGQTRFASRIEQRQLTVSGSGDHEAQVWQIQGRGVLAMLADAALYPEYGINEFTRKQRSFFYGSKEGTWYVASEWFQPRGLPRSAVPADHPWLGHPADWPDPDAQWIWPTDPNTLSSPGTVWFRSKFTLTTAATITVYASADDQVTLFVDGFPALATVSGEKHSFRAAPKFSIRLAAGEHLLAAEVLNSDASIPEVQPIVTGTAVRPTYVKDTNKYYLGSNVWDGQFPYVYGDGHVDGGGAGPAAFDGDMNSYWLSIGNYQSWSSAYDWVEGTFPAQTVTAVRVKMRGGPYNVYVSLKNGGNGWNGDSTVPYVTRKTGGWVDTGADIRYVSMARVGMDAEVTINIPAQTADRIRVTLSAEWDSGLGQYRYRTAIYDVMVTSESREGSYIRGGNFAGLLVTVASTDDSGAVTGIIHRSQPEGWLCKTGDRPGWRPAQIVTQIIAEAKSRNVLGVLPLKLGFDDAVDSYGVPWTLPRKDVAYSVGDGYLSIIKKIVEDSQMDVWIEPDTLFLHAAPKRGVSRTTGAGIVILRPGQSLTDFSVDNNRPDSTRLIVESEYGWMEVADLAPEVTYGRVEGFVSLGHALSADEARSTATNELARFGVESYDTTVRTTDVLGPRPYIEYTVGDRVLIPLGIGAESAFGINRVLSFRVSEGDAGELDVTVEADRELDVENPDA